MVFSGGEGWWVFYLTVSNSIVVVGVLGLGDRLVPRSSTRHGDVVDKPGFDFPTYDRLSPSTPMLTTTRPAQEDVSPVQDPSPKVCLSINAS